MNLTLQHTLSHSLTFMFRDDDWFWKVSLGALALLLIPVAAGYCFAIGFLVETVRRCRRHEDGLPDWSDIAPLWKSGRSVAPALALYTALASLALGAMVHQTSLPVVLLSAVLVHAFAGPFVILRYLEHPTAGACFNLRALARLAASCGMRAFELSGYAFSVFVIVLCFGWMALIVGWPFFIFWGMLVSASFTAQLAPAPAPLAVEAAP